MTSLYAGMLFLTLRCMIKRGADKSTLHCDIFDTQHTHIRSWARVDSTMPPKKFIPPQKSPLYRFHYTAILQYSAVSARVNFPRLIYRSGRRIFPKMNFNIISWYYRNQNWFSYVKYAALWPPAQTPRRQGSRDDRCGARPGRWRLGRGSSSCRSMVSQVSTRCRAGQLRLFKQFCI